MKKPLYQELMDSIREEIEHKSPNEPIASERDLAVQYSASRMTIRKAIDHLVEEGYLYRLKNTGTFVADKNLRKKSNTELIASQSTVVPKSRILYFNVKEISKDIAEKMNVVGEELVVKIVRLQIEEKPKCIDEIYLLKKYLSDKDLGDMNKFLTLNLCPEHHSLSQSLYPMLVPIKYAQLLELKQDVPIIMAENIVRNQFGAATVFFRSYYNPNQVTIHFQY